MTLRCNDFNESLLDLVYGEIDGPAAEMLREHAASCAPCRESLEDLLLTRRMAALLPPVEADDRNLEHILAMGLRAADGFVTGRASRPAKDETKLEPAFVDRGPGFWDRLRAVLLGPAFATAAAACLVLAVALVLYQRGAGSPGESRSEGDAPFLGPIGDGEVARERRLASEAPDLSQAALAAKEGSLTDPAPGYATQGPGLIGTGRGGGGEQPRGSAGRRLGTAGPEPSGGGATAASALPPAAARAEELADLLIDDSWPEARAGLGELEAAPRAKAAPAAPSKAFADAPPPAKGGLLATGDEGTYEAALAAWQRGDCAAAPPLFERALADPGLAAGTRASTLHHLALCDKRGGRCSQAVRRYEELLLGYPAYGRRPEALWEAAACHRRLADLDQARLLLAELAGYPAWRERAFEELRVIEQLAGAR